MTQPVRFTALNRGETESERADFLAMLNEAIRDRTRFHVQVLGRSPQEAETTALVEVLGWTRPP